MRFDVVRYSNLLSINLTSSRLVVNSICQCPLFFTSISKSECKINTNFLTHQIFLNIFLNYFFVNPILKKSSLQKRTAKIITIFFISKFLQTFFENFFKVLSCGQWGIRTPDPLGVNEMLWTNWANRPLFFFRDCKDKNFFIYLPNFLKVFFRFFSSLLFYISMYGALLECGCKYTTVFYFTKLFLKKNRVFFTTFY